MLPSTVLPLASRIRPATNRNADATVWCAGWSHKLVRPVAAAG